MKNKQSPWLTFVAALFIIGIIIVGVILGNKSQPPSSRPLTLSEDYPTLGPADAKVTFVEFSDFQCPYCQRLARDTMPTLEKEYEGKVKFVYHYFPLGHDAGNKAAAAAICAQEQGKFWEYRNLIANDYPNWLENLDKLDEFAQKVSLDMDKFKSCRSSNEVSERIKKYTQESQDKGVDSTPTIFINDEKIIGAQDISVYRQKIDNLLR